MIDFSPSVVVITAQTQTHYLGSIIFHEADFMNYLQVLRELGQLVDAVNFTVPL